MSSRNPLSEVESSSSQEKVQPDDLELFKIEISSLSNNQRQDEFCVRIINDMMSNRNMSNSYVMKNNLLYKKNLRENKIIELLVLPKKLFAEVMAELHDNPWT